MSKPPLLKSADGWNNYLKPWIRARIGELQEELERPMDEVQTAHTRGQIAELRHIMREVEPEAPIEGGSSSYFPTGNRPS